MADWAEWVAPIATMIAAIMTAANLGARVTGWGFAVFSVGAVAWIVVALASGQRSLLLSNAFLLLVDLIGIWRWLGREARYDAGAADAAEKSIAAPAPALFALSSLEGRPVHDPEGATIATVVEAMAACTDGTITYLVVREGGVAGIGERLHAIGWDEVQVRDDCIVVPLDAEALAARPTLAAERWPGSAEEAGVA